MVVEHDPKVMAIADHIVDMGPGAGKAVAGQWCSKVRSKSSKKSGTLTVKHLSRHEALKEKPRTGKGHLPIENATVNNLDNVTVKIPKGVLTVVTGVAGSGKSSH